jgi:S1-C subfamily serine protease
MRRRVSSAVAFVLVATSMSQAQGQQPAVGRSNSLPWVVSVVHAIDSDRMVERLRKEENVRIGVPGNPPRKLLNITTGLVVDGDGHVVTRLTNLEPGDKDEIILVTISNGSRVRARLVGVDGATGFAVLDVPSLKMQAPGFAPISLLADGMAVRILSADVPPKQATADSSRQALIDYSIRQDLGQVAMGSNYAKARGALTLNSSNLLSRNDGSIVTTFDNQIAGIAQYAGFGRAYLFPFEFIRDTIAKRVIAKQGSVAAGWLGVKVDDLTQLSESEFSRFGLAKRSGVIVREAVPDSPAASGGVKGNDILVGLGEFEVNSKADLSAALSSLPAGHTVRLRAIRNREKLEVDVVLGPRPHVGQMVAYLESETPDGSLAAQRDSLRRRLDQLNTQYRANSKTPPTQAREETRRELEIEMRQLWDSIRMLDQESPPPPAFGSDNQGTQDPRIVFFDEGFAARDLDRELEPQLASFFAISKGVLVVSVVKGSTSDLAGIKAGDVIVGTYHKGGLTCGQLDLSLSRQGMVSLRILREKRPVVVRIRAKTR